MISTGRNVNRKEQNLHQIERRTKTSSEKMSSLCSVSNRGQFHPERPPPLSLYLPPMSNVYKHLPIIPR